MNEEGSSRGSSRGRGWRGRGSHRGQPPGLRGRDIGMFYAKKQRDRQAQNRSVVTLDERQKRSIRNLFGSFQRGDLQPKGHHQSFMLDYQRHLDANAMQSVDSQMSTHEIKPKNVVSEMSTNAESTGKNVRMSTNEIKPKNVDSQISANAKSTGENVDSQMSTGENVRMLTNSTKNESQLPENQFKVDNENPIKVETADHPETNSILTENVADSWESLPTLADIRPIDEKENSEFLEKLREMQNDPKFVNMLQFRKKLPAFEKKNELVRISYENVLLFLAVICNRDLLIVTQILKDIN
jgi:hypothetical protein